MWRYTVLVLLILAASCKQEPEKAIDFDDLAPVSGKDYDHGPSEDSLQRDERPEPGPLLTIADTLMDDLRWVKWDTTLYADRFGAKQQEKWFAIGKNDSLVLLRYEFRDSTMTRNAFFNWLDCFGPKCVSYRVGDNIRIPRRSALLLVGAKELIMAEGSRPMGEKQVRAALLKQQPGKKNDPKKENWLYVVTVPRSGTATWKRIAQGEEQPITQSDENN